METIYELLHQLKELLNPKNIIDFLTTRGLWFTYLGLGFIVFAETGLAVGFFLPGDSLLVVSGLMARTLPDKLNVILVLIAFFTGSVLGDSTGYWTGRWMRSEERRVGKECRSRWS